MGLEIINKLKKEQGMTSIELSNKSGVPIGTLNKILNGQTKNPTFEVISALAHALGCTVDSFDDASTKSKKVIRIDDIEQFNTPEAAMQFILKQPAIAAYGGFDIKKMSDEEIMEFANELLRQLKLLGYKYSK